MENIIKRSGEFLLSEGIFLIITGIVMLYLAKTATLLLAFILSVGLLISSVLMFINGVLGIIFLSFGSVLNMIYLYNGIQYLGVKDKNKHGYIYLCTVAFCILFFVILSLFLGMISNKDRYGNNYIRENSNYYDDGNWYYN